MRILKIMLIVLVLCVVSALSISCGPESESAVVTEEQIVAVQRGDLTVDITAVGNLAFSYQEELAFEVEGTVGEVLVEVGDFVEEGQVLAKLDDKSIRNAELIGELDVAQAEVAVTSAKVALEAAQQALEKAENPYTESDIAQAELAVINAQIALDKAQENFEKAKDRYEMNPTVPEWAQDYELKQKQLAIAEFDLAEAEEMLAEMKSGADPLEVEQKQKQLAVAEVNLKEAENNLVEMLDSVYSLVVAPFSGIVISVYLEEGEAVNANQVVIELVDPGKFEAEILVNEIDIFNIRLGAEASIQVDAMQGISLPAKVTYISPTATIQQGVVNYRVKVEIQSLQAVLQERQEARQREMPEISSGELPERIRQAIEEGRITQEQAEEMMRRMQEGEMPFPPGAGQGEISPPAGDGQLPTMIPEEFQLREGLTVTVSIIVEERNDVLLVPNSAITSSGRQTYVKVLSPGGVIEDRLVTTGISDWQHTEVIDGLSEGEKIVIPETTSPSSTTPQQGGSMPFFPGGGMRR